jgi:peptide deformylase
LALQKEEHYEMDHLTGVLICDYGKNLQNEKAQNDRYQGMDL